MLVPLVENLLQAGSRVTGDKDWLANRPDGDYKEYAAGEVCNSEIARTLRGRALRGNILAWIIGLLLRNKQCIL